MIDVPGMPAVPMPHHVADLCSASWSASTPSTCWSCSASSRARRVRTSTAPIRSAAPPPHGLRPTKDGICRHDRCGRSRLASQGPDPPPLGHAGGGGCARRGRGGADAARLCRHARCGSRATAPIPSTTSSRRAARGGKHLLFAGHTDVVPPGDVALDARPVRAPRKPTACSTGAAPPT